MADMLKRALAKWKGMEDEQKWLEGEIKPEVSQGRPEDLYPKNGLVLRQTTRDLPREQPSADWRSTAWNKDYVWFTQDEAQSLALGAVGTVQAAPKPLLIRLARFALKDTVRGQSPAFPESAIKEIDLAIKAESQTGAERKLKLFGFAKAEEVGRWAIAGYRDMNLPSDQKRGFDLKLSGRATWNEQTRRFTEFSLVAAGTRWGATQYNGRSDDLGPAPIGFLFELASDKPADKVPPSDFAAYGWRR